MHGGFADGETGRVVGVEDAPPIGVDLVYVIAIPERMRTVRAHDVGNLTPGRVWLRHVLTQAVCDIDAKSVDSSIGPEAYGAPEVLPYLIVLPVEVGLFGGEAVEVPLTVTSGRPGRPSE